MKNPFKSHWTKWMPLGTFLWDNLQYLVMVRGNKKTGAIKFKTVRINPLGISDCVRPVMPSQLIDPTTQWNEFQKLLNS